MGYRLGVDLGTTYTAAALNIDGRVEMLSLGNRATQIASVLFIKEDGQVLLGEPAEHRGAAEPARLVREFKRRIGDAVPLIIGGAPYSPQSLLAKVLAGVVAVATRQQGAPPEHVCVSYPANWGPFKREILEQVVKLAGLSGVSTCTEPEAAAIAYASRGRVPDGARLAVYDLGGGTFDAAVLVKEGPGFRLVGTPDGIEHLGGIDFDAAIAQHVLDSLGEAAQQLDDTDPASLLGLTRLRRDCVTAKETLSSDVDTVIPVALPGLAAAVPLTRAEFEQMVRPAISETVAAMRRALGSAGVAAADLHAIVLVGGSSRIPLVSQELAAAFGRPLALDNHPKHDVAVGAAIRAAAAQPVAAWPGGALARSPGGAVAEAGPGAGRSAPGVGGPGRVPAAGSAAGPAAGGRGSAARPAQPAQGVAGGFAPSGYRGADPGRSGAETPADPGLSGYPGHAGSDSGPAGFVPSGGADSDRSRSGAGGFGPSGYGGGDPGRSGSDSAGHGAADSGPAGHGSADPGRSGADSAGYGGSGSGAAGFGPAAYGGLDRGRPGPDPAGAVGFAPAGYGGADRAPEAGPAAYPPPAYGPAHHPGYDRQPASDQPGSGHPETGPPGWPPDGNGAGWAAGGWPDQPGPPGRAQGWSWRWVMLGAAAVAVLLVVGVVLVPRIGRQAATPTAPPTAPPTAASVPTQEPTTAPPTADTGPPLPQSAQPLPADVIVWPQLRNGNWDIGTLSAAGQVGPVLAANPEEDTIPVISPDRRTVLYLHTIAPGTRELRAVGADGSGDRALFNPVPDGCGNVTRPAFGVTPQPQLVLPCVDPATGDTTLKLVTPAGQVLRELDRGWLSDPALTPDGRYVLYWQDNAARGEGGAIYQTPTDGSGPPVRITQGPPVRDNDAAVSPKGDLVAITRAGQGIWTVSLDPAHKLTQLTKDPTDMDASWSPDAGQIVFKRRDQMWVMNADGSGIRRLSPAGDIGTAPAWSPR